MRDARGILCNMTHRGATGADSRDGDGAGLMSAIPHELLTKEVASQFGVTVSFYLFIYFLYSSQLEVNTLPEMCFSIQMKSSEKRAKLNLKK